MVKNLEHINNISVKDEDVRFLGWTVLYVQLNMDTVYSDVYLICKYLTFSSFSGLSTNLF